MFQVQKISIPRPKNKPYELVIKPKFGKHAEDYEAYGKYILNICKERFFIKPPSRGEIREMGFDLRKFNQKGESCNVGTDKILRDNSGRIYRIFKSEKIVTYDDDGFIEEYFCSSKNGYECYHYDIFGFKSAEIYDSEKNICFHYVRKNIFSVKSGILNSADTKKHGLHLYLNW